MIESLLTFDRVVTIAHKGGAMLRPENTLAAFDCAVSLAVDALECDVRLSSDREVVVIHDATLERTTDARGDVAAMTASALGRVDAGFHFGAPEGYPFRGRGVGVPRLHELLERHRTTPVVIEIKGDDLELAWRTVDVIRAHDAVDRVIVGGFHDRVLRAVRQAIPGIVTSASHDEVLNALFRSWCFLAPVRPAFRLLQVPRRWRGMPLFRRSFVRVACRAGLPVQIWTVNDPAEMRRLIKWGVTGLITDRPDLAIEITRHTAR